MWLNEIKAVNSNSYLHVDDEGMIMIGCDEVLYNLKWNLNPAGYHDRSGMLTIFF